MNQTITQRELQQDIEPSYLWTMLLLWVLVGVLVVGIIGIAVHKSWPILFPEVVETAPLDSACNLRAGPCVSTLPGGGSVAFSIKPNAIPVMTPLAATVRMEGIEATRVELDISGVSMNMGFNRIALKPSADGYYQGTIQLAACIRDRMEWEAKVLITDERGLIAAPYRFVTSGSSRASGS